MSVQQQSALNFEANRTILSERILSKQQIIDLIQAEAREEKEELTKDVSKFAALPLCMPVWINKCALLTLQSLVVVGEKDAF